MGDNKGQLSRRDILGLGLLGGIMGALGVFGARNEFLSLRGKIDPLNYSFQSVFKTYIFSDEKINNRELSEEVKKLIAESNCNGYTEVSFNAPQHSKVDIYHGFYLIAKEVYEDDLSHRFLGDKVKPLIPRETGKGYFYFDVISPVFNGLKQFKVSPYFLDNNKLLDKILEADSIWEAGLGKYFTHFHLDVGWESVGPNTSKRGVPKGCYIGFKDRGIEYYYDIRGLEVLVGGDKELFSKYWELSKKFKSFEDFKRNYEVHRELSK